MRRIGAWLLELFVSAMPLFGYLYQEFGYKKNLV